MLLPSSIEFTNLCRIQVALLMQSFEASMGAVYLSKELTAKQQGELIPIVMYPEDPGQNLQSTLLELPARVARSAGAVDPSSSLLLTPIEGKDFLLTASSDPRASAKMLPAMTMPFTQPQRLVVPLIHEEMVLGLLVVARDRPHWSDTEQSQVQKIAHTLAIACILDQRSQWLGNAQYRQRTLQSAQQQTLSNLLHQFRNPLTALKTLGKLLQKRFNEDETNRKIAMSIVEQSDRLEKMLHQFDEAIDLGEAALEPIDTEPWVSEPVTITALPPSSVLPLGEEALHLQPCSFAEVLYPLIESAVGRIDQQRLQLTVQIPSDLPPIQADVSALREVCSNLLDNALKYTPPGGEVQVDLYRQQSEPGQIRWQVLLISDSGPGIPQADLTRIFERQYRGIQVQTEIPGTGLGLAIAQALVTQMHGEIEALSPRLDHEDRLTTPGSTFRVKLPESDIWIKD
ncbi:MAG: GAF domain-containing protein [Acaryochloris sp. RU_4_1]|nr:GAF domain-containing protein [Acaryochloris sp. RU_4_1]NJR55991.1 GAF domain-containing protein [Acaryochloris sp. CRU_2_0]